MDCDGCTHCCTHLDIPSMDSPVGYTCTQCDKGCTIYDTRPAECVSFNCVYNHNKNYLIVIWKII